MIKPEFRENELLSYELSLETCYSKHVNCYKIISEPISNPRLLRASSRTPTSILTPPKLHKTTPNPYSYTKTPYHRPTSEWYPFSRPEKTNARIELRRNCTRQNRAPSSTSVFRGWMLEPLKRGRGKARKKILSLNGPGQRGRSSKGVRKRWSRCDKGVRGWSASGCVHAEGNAARKRRQRL